MLFLIYFLLSTKMLMTFGSDSILEAVYWEVKPFVFTNEKGDIDGIIPRIFKEGESICSGNVSLTFVKFSRKIEDRKLFFSLLHSDTPYGEGLLAGINQSKALWVPSVAFYDKRNESFETFRGIRTYQLVKSSAMVVIVPRYTISLPNKIFRGILSCNHVIVLSLLLSIFFGMLLWLMERFSNDQFSKGFIRGAGTGMWWSLVSMTTVGYGDFVPRTLLGRIVALTWVFIGVIIACVMTATTTEIVTGVEDLNVYEKKVSVLENSIEAKEASENYGAYIVPATSYEQVLQLIRDGTVFAGMINADIAAWYHDEIASDTNEVPLRIVKKLSANIDISVMITRSLSDDAKRIFRCMYNNSDDVYKQPVEDFHRYCHIETLYLDTFEDFFKENLLIQILLGVISFLILLGLMFECYTKTYGKLGMSQRSCKNIENKLIKDNGNQLSSCSKCECSVK